MRIYKLFIIIVLLFSLLSCTNNEIILEDEEEIFIVEVKGKIKFPGIYRFNSEIYMYDLIKAAGGLLDNADDTNINYSEVINKSCVIVIPEKKKTNDNQESLININYASVNQLMSLPKIGEATAIRIIEYRETHGLFKKIEDIMNVPGIKESIYNQIKDKITV